MHLTCTCVACLMFLVRRMTCSWRKRSVCPSHEVIQKVTDDAGPLGKPEDFRVVWPTVSAVRDINEGWFAGCSIPGAQTIHLLVLVLGIS